MQSYLHKNMNTFIQLIFITILILPVSCEQKENATATISWDMWGVPHIRTDTIEDLFFAQGWAQMKNHGNLILDLYGSSRGKGAEYWGESRLQNDILIHTLGFDELADEWESNQDEELKTIYSSFVDGLNAYASEHLDEIDEKYRVVLPLMTKDVNMHTMNVIFTRFIGGGDLGLTQNWPDMGSNAMAVAPSRSASGNAMLVQNPHLPWSGEFLFFESHLMLGDQNMYGATLVGFPGIAIGFNETLGWTHTNNTIDNADTYELELADGGYLLDGERKEFETSSTIIKVLQEDGSLVENEIPLMKTAHGPVVSKSEDKVLAFRLVGLDRPNMLLQWWHMINSTTFDEFEGALKMAQIPFWNVMYADQQGEIFYLFNGLVPKRSSGTWEYWNRIIPGGKSADIWTGVHDYADLPKIKNPAGGWLQNANDPPWTSTIPMTLNSKDFPHYMSPLGMGFRAQRAARMLIEDESITFDELVDYKHSTRLEFADRILDDLFAAVDASNSSKAKEAKVVLENWDRNSDADSKGMLLFYNWANKFNVNRADNYKEPWSWEKPSTTPDGLADPAYAVELLEQAAIEIEGKFGSLDTPWGDFYRIDYNGHKLPANGVDGSLGVFRVSWPANSDGEHMYVSGGDSWVGVIEFGEQVKAKVLLSYGNSTQINSPHSGDQLELFAEKKLRDAWFTNAEVDANTVTVEGVYRKKSEEKE